MKVDILAVGVHPDDIELSCSGTLFQHLAQGHTVAICDLSAGELGSRGNAQLRLEEAETARKIFGIESRLNLGLADGFFQRDRESLTKLIEVIRFHQPDVVLANAKTDRHPDHGRAAEFIAEASFLSGLRRIETTYAGVEQPHWRPRAVYHYIQDYYQHPDFVVDISGFMEKKIEVIMAFSSQFYNPESDEPETPISTKNFLEFIEGRARQFGRLIGTEYGEGFNTRRAPGVDNILKLK